MIVAILVTTVLSILTLAQNTPYSSRIDANGNFISSYSPGRAPSVPLAVRSPYTSAWSSTAYNGSLNTNGVEFWNGDRLGWEGIVWVDGIAYEWMGTGRNDLPFLTYFKMATPVSVFYDSQYSNFTFTAGPVQIVASFFSPVTPEDLCRMSLPLSYLTVDVVSTDGQGHEVKLYLDVNGAWSAVEGDAALQWSIYRGRSPINATVAADVRFVNNSQPTNITVTSDSLLTWIVQLQRQYLFAEQNDRALWGNFSFTSSQGSAIGIAFQSGHSLDLRFNFASGLDLTNIDDADYRGWFQAEPVFAFEHELGLVGPNGGKPVVYTIGSVQTPAMRYTTTQGLVELDPWWMHCYGDIFSMIDFHYRDLASVQALGSAYESKLKADVNSYFGNNPAPVYNPGSPTRPPPYWNGTLQYTNGTTQFGQPYVFDSTNAYGFLEPVQSGACFATGIAVPDVSEAESYYAIVALSARQVMGAYVLTARPSGDSNQAEPFSWQKEISSDGNVNTVDVMFPAMPFLLYSNPALLRYNMEPLYQYQESGYYPNQYSMHDLGTHFPNATGHVEGNDEYMPVEESGNMIIMTLAYFSFTGDISFLTRHYAILRQWAQYLIDYSLVPAIQLSTDDFAGMLANQTNLAIKGIVGLAAMSRISTLVGDPTSAQNYSVTSQQYYTQWEDYAIDPSMRHTTLAYQWRSSYGLLYNTYPDLLLNLDVVSRSVYQMQSNWYPEVSQIFGIPLDSRHSYTKSDWEMWTAATCDPATRRLFINALAYWLNDTTSAGPFSDLYDTISTGEQPSVRFNARPVVGGHFALLALDAPQPGRS